MVSLNDRRVLQERARNRRQRVAVGVIVGVAVRVGVSGQIRKENGRRSPSDRRERASTEARSKDLAYPTDISRFRSNRSVARSRSFLDGSKRPGMRSRRALHDGKVSDLRFGVFFFIVMNWA